MEADLLPLYSAAQVRELDRRAIDGQGLPGGVLMARAGEAAFRRLTTDWPAARSVAIVCGAGNNAGDGYVVARLAAEAGLAVGVGYLAEPESLRGDARAAWQQARDAGVSIAPFDAGQLTDRELVVDALLGTGLQRAVADRWAQAVEAINAAPVPVLALDIPSGLHADSGAVLGVAVRARATVTFIGRKFGLYTGSGPEFAGRVSFEDLGVPGAVYRDLDPLAWQLGAGCLPRWLAPRRRCVHKGEFGHVLVIGGQPGMGGAARLAGEAAARSGAGLVSLVTHAGHAAAIPASRPELMVTGVTEAVIPDRLLARATVLALGPGLGREDWGRGLYARALAAGLPAVVDADALNLLAAEPVHREDWILTPHPGEAARLLGTQTAAVEADRLAAVTELHRRYGGVVVLKGAGTLIHDGHRTRLSSTGNPGMASGGMGDVLTGVIAGLLAQGLPAAEAAALGVYVHGAAGDAAGARGERGLLAGDLLARLRHWVNPAGGGRP